MLHIIDWLILPRETRELARLNRIHEALNENKITPQEARNNIYKYKWEYHHDKIDFLVQFTILLKKQ